MQNTSFGDVKLSYVTPKDAAFSWERTSKLSPLYPLKLAKNGITGCGIFKISVNEKGKASVDETLSYLPKAVIKREGIKLIKSFDWKQVNDKEVNTATVRIDFCLGGESIDMAQQLCTEQSKLKCTE